MASKDYEVLLENYQQMFELFDDIHFNSSVTEGVYKKHLKIKSSQVISISHSGIEDNRISREYKSDILNLIFIGNTTTYKGFPLLEQVLIELYKEGKTNFALEVWGATGESECELIKYKGFYNSSELLRVFHTDGVLCAPSVWNETFSLITLEALSYGIPALVSSTVGAKDIVSSYDSWFVFADRVDLKRKLSELLTDKTRLKEFNKSIMESPWKHSLEEHTQDILTFYKRETK